MKLKAFAAAALLAVSAASQATVTNWGIHAPLEVGFGFNTPGVFLDYYTFAVTPDISVVASVTVSNDNNIPGLPSSHISNGVYGLYWDPDASVASGLGVDGDELQYPLFGSFCNGAGFCGFNGQTGNTINATLTVSGFYFYAVTGVADGSGGGVYTITSATAPIPEPETYALLLAGLGAVGFMSRRRAR